MTASAPVITLSAAYGALGSLIGPRVADRLQVPFLDRAIPAEVARHLAVSLDEAESHDEQIEHGLERALASFASVPMLLGAPPPETLYDARAFKDETERVLRAHVREGGVILGRAGALVLADHPTALHARLDGPVAARVAQVARVSGIGDDEARQRLRDADRAREGYVKHFYRTDPGDPRLYHLILDSTALDPDTCVELIIAAAAARSRPTPPRGRVAAARRPRSRDGC